MNTFGAAIQDAGVFQFLIGTVLLSLATLTMFQTFKSFQFLIGTVLLLRVLASCDNYKLEGQFKN